MTPRHEDVTVGVDVGGTSTRIVVFSDVGEQIEARTSATPLGGAALLAHLGDGIADSVAIDSRRLTGVGVGIPGGVAGDGTVSMALNIGIEQPLALGPMLSSRLGVPVRVENDVNAAALGAYVRLGCDARSSLAYLSIGTGLAAGLVIDGEIVRGSRGAAGEIGHIPLPHGDARCQCGQIGCVETVASGRALIARMRAAGIDGRADDLWTMADAGHAAAAAIRDDAVAALAWCCQAVLLMLDVDCIVIGGGVGIGLGHRLIDPITAALAEQERHSPFLGSIGLGKRLIASPTGIEVGALGADRSATLVSGGRIDSMSSGTLRLAGGRVLTPDGGDALLDVTVAEGTIAGVGAGGRSHADRVLDVSGLYVAPGFIDLQLNGGWGHDFTSDPTSICAVARRLPGTGVTAFLPTIVTAPEAVRWKALDAIGAIVDEVDAIAATPLGLHFEGPAISPARPGAHDTRWIGPPAPAEVDAWRRERGVAMVTVAPECEGALDLVATLTAAHVVVAAGHSQCSPVEFAAARRSGVTMVTHLFNAMSSFSHRDPGLVGCVLAGDVFAGLICDGIHVDPLAVLVAWRTLGAERTVLVTDAMAALGLDTSQTQLGDVTVFIDETGVRTADGVLAGSNLTLDQAVRNLVAFTGCSPAAAITTVTRNPAAVLGIADRGRIAVGARADLVLLDDSLNVVQTFVGGVQAWKS